MCNNPEKGGWGQEIYVVSWAGQNPGAKVWYVLTSPAADDSDGLVRDIQHHYENLQIVGADLDKMFSQTPLEELFKSGNWSRNTRECPLCPIIDDSLVRMS